MGCMFKDHTVIPCMRMLTPYQTSQLSMHDLSWLAVGCPERLGEPHLTKGD